MTNTFKVSSNEEKRGQMVDGKMSVVSQFYLTVENERGNIVFSWTAKTQEAAAADVAKFNEVKSDPVALKAFVAEIKSR